MKIYDPFITSKNEKLFKERIEKVLKEIGRGEEFLGESESLEIDALKIRKIIEDIREMMKNPGDLEYETFSSLRIKDPSWMMDLEFANVADINRRLEDFGAFRSRTGGDIFISQETEKRRSVQSPCDHGFIVSVLNCEVEDPSSIEVPNHILHNASSDDLEVMDAAHEIQRIFGESCSFGFGAVEVESGELAQDYDLKNAIKRHFEGKELHKSASIYIISESRNLMNGRAIEILELIPFDDLQSFGVEELLVEFISCNTMEIGSEIMAKLEEIARDCDIKITTHIHNGYIFNNIVFGYVARKEYDKLLGGALEEVLPNLLESDSLEASKLHDLDDEDLHAPSPSVVYGPTEKHKTAHLVQISLPGFSNIYAENMEELSQHVIHKNISAPKDVVTQFSFEEAEFGAADRASHHHIKKTFLVLGSRPSRGFSMEFTADYREIEIEQSPDVEVAAASGSGLKKSEKGVVDL